MNALEMYTTEGEYIRTIYIKIKAIDMLESYKKKELANKLRRDNIPYYWSTSEYLGYKPGLYIFSEDDELTLPHIPRKEFKIIDILAVSYPAKFLLKKLIDSSLQNKSRNILERLGEDKHGNIIYKFKDPLFSWPSNKVVIYEFYRLLFYRIEHVRHIIGYKPTGEAIYSDKLYLLPTIRLKITTKMSLKNIIKKIDKSNLLSSLLYRRVEIVNKGQKVIGLLTNIDINKDTARVQVSDKEVEVLLSNIFLQTNPTWYREFLRGIGLRYNSTYDELLDNFGLLTYRYEPFKDRKKKRKQMKDAPIRYLKDLRIIIRDILAKIFPIRFQYVEYNFDKNFVKLIEGD